MAQTTEEIIAIMDAEQASQTDLAGITTTSKTGIFTLVKSIVAQCQNYLEQLWDRKKVEITSTLTYGNVGTPLWIRSKALEFQYNAVTPQVIELINGYPTYPVIDESLRIVTRCVMETQTGTTDIRVAKNEPPEKLTTPEKAALQAYYTNTGDGTTKGVGLAVEGQAITVISLDPDFLFIQMGIYYNSNFANFPNDCLQAMQDFISNSPSGKFNLGLRGVFFVSDLIKVIQSIEGYSYHSLTNIAARSAATAFASRTTLVSAGAVVVETFVTASGYMIPETTASNTWADKIVFYGT